MGIKIVNGLLERFGKDILLLGIGASLGIYASNELHKNYYKNKYLEKTKQMYEEIKNFISDESKIITLEKIIEEK